MIKTSAIFSAHAIHVLLRNTLIFFVVLFVALFVWAAAGIKIDSLKLFDYRVDGLYIKLDKKLILKAKTVHIPQRKANPSFDNVDKTFQNIKYLLTFFQDIELDEIDFRNNTLEIIFRDNILQLGTNDYLVRGNIEQDDDILKGEIPILYLKKQDIVLKGTFSYDLQNDVLNTKGKVIFHETIGEFTANKTSKDVDFSFKSKSFSDLRSIVSKFELPSNIESWIVDKVTAKSYKLLSFKGKGKIENSDLHIDIESLKGKALLSGVDIYFKEGVDAVHAKRVILNYYDRGLYFDLYQPVYKEKHLDGSTVAITGLGQHDAALALMLKSDTTLDTDIKELLQTYDIHIPLRQENGRLQANVSIDIGLKEKYTDIHVSVDVNESDIYLGETKLHVLGGRLGYEDNIIHIEKMRVSEPDYVGVLNGEIDIKKKEGKCIFDAKKLQVKAEKKVVWLLKNVSLPFSFEYKKDLKFKLPKLAIEMHKKDEESVFTFKDLNTIKSYLVDKTIVDRGGNFEVRTKDFKHYTFKGLFKRSSCFLYEKEKSCKSSIPVHGDVTPTNLNFYALGKKIHYNQAKSRIDIKNLNIDLKKFLDNTQKKSKKVTTSSSKRGKKLIIIGKNSNLRYESYTLLTDSYDVTVDKKGNIKAIGSSAGDIIKFSKIGAKVAIQALRMKDEVLHPLINFHGLQGGRYSLKVEGNPKGTMKGQILIEGGVMKGFKAYKSTSKFVKTLPELETLHQNNDKNGYHIKEGVIEYRMIESKKIIFDSIYIKGETSTIVGKGELNLVDKTMDIRLTIQVAKEIGKVLGSIPVVGYILMGEDKSINVGLKVTGKIDNPKVQTSAVKDILTTPFEVIKRTLESPAHILPKKLEVP
ncbi:MAG TPA: hypothetical protein ENJ34_04775 [Epsilonproteobacteria bacterium]|nr:hypothetical protein [Campylobacterota bacterium]